METKGNTAANAIDIDDLIELEKTKIICPKNEVFETVRERYVDALLEIGENVKPNTNLKAKLEDAASFASHADKPTFIRRYSRVWSGYVKAAVRDAKAEMEKKQKMFEEVVGFNRSCEDEAFRKGILKPARERYQTVEANQEFADDLIDDLNVHAAEI